MTKLLSAIVVGASALSLFAFPAAAADQKEGKKLFHVVSLKFKDGAKKEQIKAVEDAFADLKDKITGIVGITWGTNVSPEKHDKGFTHCFILCFDTEKARDEYLVHPDHKAFGKVLGPVLADVFVIDFWGDVRQGHDNRADAGK
jgi:stress responsive alpha/beta barrel protein